MSKLIFLIALIIINANAALSDEPWDRILGGTDSRIKDFPYQVSIEVNGTHDCGGSIISAKYILTAAHCLDQAWPGDIQVRVGSSWKGKLGTLYDVKTTITHEDYEFREDGIPLNDIGLIELIRSIKFGVTRRPIELFKANEVIPEDSEAVVSGWGWTGSPVYLDRLQTVTLPIISRARCNVVYEGKSKEEEPYIPEGQFCAGDLENGDIDTCQGDSGGPLTINGRLAGIISWGDGCGTPLKPGGYTEIAYYRNWIKKYAKV